MNVLLIHNSHSEGGGDAVYIRLLMKHLPGFSVNAFLISIEQDREGFTAKCSHGAEANLSSFRSQASLGEFVESFCRTRQIDLVHIHTLYLPFVVEACLKLLPVIKTPHSTDLICPGTYKFFSKSETICQIPFGLHCIRHAYQEKCCSRSPKKLLANYTNVYQEVNRFSRQYKSIMVMSEYVKQECIAAGVPASKLVVNPYFTEPANGTIEPKQESIQSRLLFIGRLSQIKGVHTLLRALRPLLLNQSLVHLDVVGDGPYRKKIHDLVVELGVQDQVTFHGWLDHTQVGNMLQQCSCLLVPSIYPEAFGITGIEAMMHRRPVVAFNVGGISTWLENGNTGFLINAGDMHGFAEKVQLLLNNPVLANNMGENGRAVAIRKFGPSIHITRLIELYNQVITTAAEPVLF